MVCRRCGARLREEDRRADGSRACPACGAVYRPRARAARPDDPPEPGEKKVKRAKKGSASKKKGRSGRALLKPGRNHGRPFALAAVAAIIALALTCVPLFTGGGADRAVSGAPAASAPTTTPGGEAGGALPQGSPSPTPTARPTPTPSPAPTEAPTPTPLPSIHFRAVGDVMSHRDQLNLARRKDGSYDYTPQFQYVRDSLARADYTIANLEMAISPDGMYSGYPEFRIPESILDALKGCGIDLFTTANNHTMDAGFEGIVKTIEELDERGFAHLGTYRSAEEAAQPLVVDINGIRVGFLAYTESINGNGSALTAEQRTFCVRGLGAADFERDVRELRDLGAELVVCLPHWGQEGWRMVSDECKRSADRMIEAGVDVILGSHPHMVQPIELREAEVDGRKKTVLIAWSLGNFISNMTYPYEDCGIILDFTVTREEDGGLRIHDVGYVPIYVWNTSKMIAALCIGDYYEQPPEGMGNYSCRRLKESLAELDDVIGRDIALLRN